MDKFIRLFGNDRLFTAHASVGELLLVLPAGVTSDSIPLGEAWSSPSLLGTFVYAATGTGVSPGTADRLVDAVLQKVAKAGQRGFMWMHDPTRWPTSVIDDTQVRQWGMNDHATVIVDGIGLVVEIAPGLRFTVPTGATLALAGSAVQIGTEQIGGSVGFTGVHAPVPALPVAAAVLSLDGAGVGTIGYDALYPQTSLQDALSWGFQFACPAGGGVLAERLTLATAAPGDAPLFTVTMDPSDPLNTAGATPRTRLAFAGVGIEGAKTTLASAYRTRQGAPVTLVPRPGSGALVFDLGAGDWPVLLAPFGDFDLLVPGVSDPADLLCGLHGTEIITFWQGIADRLRFTPYRPAYAARYPFDAVSVVTAQTDPPAALLDDTYTTSWATLVSDGGAVPYVAQPRGACLYGITGADLTSRPVGMARPGRHPAGRNTVSARALRQRSAGGRRPGRGGRLRAAGHRAHSPPGNRLGPAQARAPPGRRAGALTPVAKQIPGSAR